MIRGKDAGNGRDGGHDDVAKDMIEFDYGMRQQEIYPTGFLPVAVAPDGSVIFISPGMIVF